MKGLKIALGMVLITAAVVVGNSQSAQATPDSANCKFVYADFAGKSYGLGQGFKKHPDVVTTGFWIKGDASCRMDITLAVWKIPHATLQPHPVEEQTYFSHQTKTGLKPGFHVLATKVPDCFWQADLVRGKNPTGPGGKLPYEAGRMLNATMGGNKRCVEKPEEPEEPEDVCPNIDGIQTEVPDGHEVDGEGNCFIPEEPEEPEVPVEEPEKEAEPQTLSTQTPDVLPKTGAGAIAATFLGVSTLSGLAHAITRRFRL